MPSTRIAKIFSLFFLILTFSLYACFGGDEGVKIGKSGGTLVTKSGATLTIGTGAFSTEVNVVVDDVGYTSVLSGGASMDVAAGFELNLGNAQADQDIAVSVPNTQGLTANDQVLLVQVVNLPGGGTGLSLVNTVTVTASELTSNTSTDQDDFQGDLGVDESGTYIFVVTTQEIGFATGQVTLANGSSAGAGLILNSSSGMFIGVTDDYGYFNIPETLSTSIIYVYDPDTGAYGSIYVSINSGVIPELEITLTVPEEAAEESLPNGCFDQEDWGSFSKTGNAKVISSLGDILPAQGSGMAFISSGTGAYLDRESSFEITLTVPADAAQIKFSYNFLTNEYPEWVGSAYNDLFNVILYSGLGASLLVEERVNTSDLDDSGSGYDGETGWKQATVDISEVAGTNDVITLKFVVADVTDTIYDSVGLIDNLRFDTEDCEGPGASGGGSGSITGLVVDATTAAAISGATVTLSGAGSGSTTSNASGNYTFTSLANGGYTVTVAKTGYVSDSKQVTVSSSTAVTANFALSPPMAAGEYRIVLTWGQDPRDLDSHLYVPTGTGTCYEIYYANKGSQTPTVSPYAWLDVDDTTSYGPETTSIYDLQSGTYYFGVYLFAGTGALTTSQAIVKVYKGSSLIKTYTAPTTGTGDWWNIFSLNGNTEAITDINTIQASAPSSGCGGTTPAVPTDGSITGKVVNAIDAAAISGATVTLSGVSSGTTTSDASGNYSFTSLAYGNYTITVSKTGFVNDSKQVTVSSSTAVTANFALSPPMAAGEYRIILTWGQDPRDLDSHLWVPGTTPYEIYYSNTGSQSSSPFAVLDVDDTSSYGPETTTIYQLQTGTYKYGVYLFAGTGALTTSLAIVKVYNGSSLVKTYTVPTTGTGAWWNVFTMNGTSGAITDVNVIQSATP